jgi:hypothetical protein
MTVAIRKSTPLLFVDKVAPVLPFWTALGFAPTVEVPGPDGAPQFVALFGHGIELMIQTWDSLAHDNPALHTATNGDKSFLFMEVEDLAAVEAALAGYECYMPRRSTFYGSVETGFFDPAGHCITFAEFPVAAEPSL